MSGSQELPTTKQDYFRPGQAVLAIFFFVFAFLFSHQVSLEDSLSLCFTLLIDVVSGSMLWILISKKRQYSAFELLGLGVALGTSLSAIGQLIFRNLAVQRYFGLILSLIVASLFWTKLKDKNERFQVKNPSSSSVLGVLGVSVLLLCGDRYYLWATAALLFMGSILIRRVELFQFISSKKKVSLLAILCAVIGFALGVGSWLETLIHGNRTTASYISGWDGAIFEASSKALIRYGPFDHIFLANNKYAYYWFHDAWAGAFTQRANASDWVVTTQFGALVVAIASISLLYAIVERRITDRRLTLAVIAAVATPSLIGAPNVLLSLASFSQTVAVFWLVLILFLLDEFFRFSKKTSLVLLTCASCLLVLTKLTIAVPTIAGILAGALTVGLFAPNKGKQMWLIIASFITIAASGVLYFIFIRPAPELAQSYFQFKIGFTEEMFGIFTGIMIIDLGIFLVIKLGATSVMFSRTRLVKDPFVTCVSCISLAGFGAALLLEFELSVANSYMLLPFLVGFSLIVCLEVANRITTATTKFPCLTKFVIAMIALGLFSGALSTFRLHQLNYAFVTTTRPILIASVVAPFFVALTVFILLAIKKTLKINIPILLLVAVSSLAISSGSFISHSFRDLQRQRVEEAKGWSNPTFEDVESELNELTAAAHFMRSNLNASDVLASNSTSDKGLLAAMTGIRNFASSYVSDMQGVEARFPMQFSFAQAPSAETYAALRNQCVTWFYYSRDENNTDINNFKPFAEISYEDEIGVVLKLSDATPLPDNCA